MAPVFSEHEVLFMLAMLSPVHQFVICL